MSDLSGFTPKLYCIDKLYCVAQNFCFITETKQKSL